MMTVCDVLTKARAHISDPERWTQGYYARTESGQTTVAQSPDAVRWCALGAIAVQELEHRIYGDAINALTAVHGIRPQVFNDTHAHAEVLQMFDSAIAAQSSL